MNYFKKKMHLFIGFHIEMFILFIKLLQTKTLSLIHILTALKSDSQKEFGKLQTINTIKKNNCFKTPQKWPNELGCFLVSFLFVYEFNF